MTHMPGGETRLAPPPVRLPIAPPLIRQPGRPAPVIDHQHLRELIAERRATIGALEVEMVTQCEAVAARAASRGVRIDDRGTWDRAMWDRYLTAAAALEPDYLPRLLRLHAELARLQRLLLLPAAPEPLAAGAPAPTKPREEGYARVAAVRAGGPGSLGPAHTECRP